VKKKNSKRLHGRTGTVLNITAFTVNKIERINEDKNIDIGTCVSGVLSNSFSTQVSVGSTKPRNIGPPEFAIKAET
jgi:hypothetical protein